MNVSASLTGFDKAFKLVTELPKRTRYAASGAINDTLKDVQTETADRILPHAFTLRGRGKQWWEPGQKFGFNIRPYSNPNTLVGVMGSQADWLKLQEHGGTKKVEEHRLAIPAADYKPHSAIMARAIKPRTILSDWDKAKRSLESAQAALSAHRGVRLTSHAERQRRSDLKKQLGTARREFRSADKARKAREGLGADTGSKAFIATMKSGFTGIFKRTGRDRFPLKLLFSLTKYAKLDPVLGFEKASHDLANERYDAHFAIRFLSAMK